MEHVVNIKVCGICEVKSRWIKLQYKDEWGDEVGLFLSHETWKGMGKPWLGDKLKMVISNV